MRIPTIVALIAVLLAACQTTKKAQTPATQAASYGKVVVVAIRMPPDARIAAEAGMAAALQQRGAQAITMSSISPPGADKTAKAMVARVLGTGATKVFVLDPFVFRRQGKSVVKSVILSGFNYTDPNEEVPSAPLTYKAALYDADELRRVWIGDVNSRDQRGKRFVKLAGEAGTDAVAEAAKAKAF